MKGLGLLLLVLGAGSLVLPKFDIQFKIMDPVTPYQPWVGAGVAVLGLLMLVFGGKKKPEGAK